jgi:apolipoprotein N-acyltransferase
LSAGHTAIHQPQSVIRCWPWIAAIASGLLLALCFPGADQGWLVWVALTPLVSAVWFAGGMQSPKACALGCVAGIAFFTATFWWLGELAPLFANPWLRTLPFVLSLYMGLYVGAWAWFLALVKPRDFLSPARHLGVAALAACAWVALEWVRGWLFSGFGWNGLGVALHGDLAMIQIAEWTGVAGLSWLVAFANVMAVLVVRRMVAEFGPRFLKSFRWEFSATLALIVAVWAYGTRTLLRGDATPTVPLRVAAVQAAIPQRDKFDPEQEDAIYAQFDRLTGLALLLQPPPQLVLWPESATPRGLFSDQVVHDFVFAQARRSDAALLLGSTHFEWESGNDYNVAVLLTEQGDRLQMHRKIHLVPFGEYLPLRPVFEPFVGQLVPADFARGRDYTLLEIGEPAVKLSALICFEDTLGYLSRRFVGAGAQALVNVTNDGWFARSAAAGQHLANAIFRAVENRRPLIRCANTGVTGIVLPTGYFERWIPTFQEGVAVREVAIPQARPTTFFTRHGDVISPVSAAVAVVAAGLGVWRRARGTRGALRT